MRTNAYPPAVSRELRRAGFQRCLLKKGLPVRSGYEVTLGGDGAVVVRQRMILSGQVTLWQGALTHYMELLRMRGFLVEEVHHASHPGLIVRLNVWKERSGD